MSDQRLGGLRAILPAMVLTSILGYAVQLLVPVVVDSTTYAPFASYWGAIYLCVSAVSGVQQEIARAARRRPADAVAAPASSRTLARYAVTVAAGAAVGSAIVGVYLGVFVMRQDIAAVIVLLVVGVAGDALLATIAGGLYGTQHWRGVVWVILTDPALRLIAIAGVVGVYKAMGARPGLVPLLFAVSLPFGVAASILWLRHGRGLRDGMVLDAGLGTLLRNTLQTVIAATATGLMISGMPLVVGTIGRHMDSRVVAGTILLVTVVRAPLISPMLALQSYLTIMFRSSDRSPLKRIAMIGGALLAIAAVLSAVAAVWGPPVVARLLRSYQLPGTPAIVSAVLSAGIVAVLCVTGPAVLARGGHRMFSAGWVIAAVVTIVCAALPFPFDWRLSATLMIGPLLGIVVHLWALAAARPEGAE